MCHLIKRFMEFWVLFSMTDALSLSKFCLKILEIYK